MLKKITLLVILNFLVISLLVPVVYEVAYYGKVYPGVMVEKIDLGNLTPQKSQEKLEKEITKKIPQEIVFQLEDQTWRINTQDINLKFNTTQVVSLAYRTGRQGNLINKTKEKIAAWKEEINIGLQWQFDQEKIDNQVDLIAKAIDVPGKATQVFYQGTRIFVNPGQEGLSLDQRKLKEFISSRIAHLDSQPIIIPTRTINPIPDQEAINKLQQQAQTLVGKKIILKLEEEDFLIADTDLVSFLHYNPSIIDNNITDWVSNFSAAVNRSPKNAKFDFQNNSLIIIEPSWSGRKVTEEDLTVIIQEALGKLINQPEKELVYSLPAETIPAKIKAENIDILGIKEKIGQGESFFRGSSSARIHNIKTAAEKLNGQLIAPEEIFSFNKSIEEISTQAGYQTGYIIKDGQTIPGVGGGVCQVSTTMFRTILNAGLPIEERHPHAYRVGVYEQESHPGLDATVFAPSPDLKFKNDTGYYILIQTHFFPQDWRLVIDFYGTQDGRISNLSNFRLWDIAPPPPALYIDDSSLPEGEIKQIDWAAYGAKAAFDWEVTRNGKILQKDTFYSYYQPWQAKYLRGTGGN
ncbi:MAG: VanW family protein [Candidatus Shapirobacteria bacterium]|nr:VanW family protein [Candidatus Shapirobacteria bacterium]